MASSRRDRQNPRFDQAAEQGNERSGPHLKLGTGRAIAHHGEILQGVFENEDGHLLRGLITLPLAAQQSTATYWPNGPGRVRTRPPGRGKAAKAAALTLKHLGFANIGGDLTIESDIPIGHGYGSSTADVVAAIRAVAAGAGVSLRCSTLSKLAVQAEGASDAIAYGEQMVLFAHRQGDIIEHLGGDYPPLQVVGFRSGGARPIDTLNLPRARYDQQQIAQFKALRGLAFRAVKQQDPRLIGYVATASARIGQHHLAKPDLETILNLAKAFDACGVQVSHSGTLMGVIFDPTEPGVVQRSRLLCDQLERSGYEGVITFFVNVDGVFRQ